VIILLPYGDSLERVLESLFADEEENEISIVKLPLPFPMPFSSCCTYSYAQFNGS